MDDYVSKPIRRQELYDAIQQLVPVPGPVPPDKGPHTRTTSTQDASASGAVVDWKCVLSSADDDEDILVTIVEATLEELPELVTTLSDALQAGDSQTANRCAHTIKGVASIFGVTALHDCARTMEADTDSGHLDTAKKLQPEMTQLVEKILNELNHRIDSSD